MSGTHIKSSMSSEALTRLTKKEIRSKILLKLKNQKEAEREKKSKIITDKLFRSLVFRQAKIVMFFISFGGEVDTKDMIKKAKKIGKIVAVPVCRARRILPCILDGRMLFRKGPYGVNEPAIQKLINLEDLDLVIVPGLAFDKKGNRLGRGKGYYDYFLDKLTDKSRSIGLAFDFQILPVVPTTSRDVSVHKVIFA